MKLITGFPGAQKCFRDQPFEINLRAAGQLVDLTENMATLIKLFEVNGTDNRGLVITVEEITS